MDQSIAVATVKSTEKAVEAIVRSSHKLMMCTMKTGEKIEGWTEEMIDVKIDGRIGEKTDESIAKWTGAMIAEKIGNSTDERIGERIGRWTAGRIIDQIPAVNSVGSIVQTMLPWNMAERGERMLA